jgi:hypothetical protein
MASVLMTTISLRQTEMANWYSVYLMTINCLPLAPSSPVLISTQPSLQCLPAALSSGVMWPGREVDHSPLSRAEVHNKWSLLLFPLYTFILHTETTFRLIRLILNVESTKSNPAV